MNHLNSWEATEGLTLVYDGECSAYDGLASDNGSKNSNYKYWPSDTFCAQIFQSAIAFISDSSVQHVEQIAGLDLSRIMKTLPGTAI